jgi:signal transduction histidine kinase
VIFDPFKKVKVSGPARPDSYGLGLAISKKLIEMMDGTIGVESEVEKGSTFYFNLPLRRSEKE